jgi:PAS domain S-box-containing protein
MEYKTNWRLSRILLVSLTLCGAVLVASAWWYYMRQREALESSVMAELSAVADVKSKQIANWRFERLGDGRVLSSSLVAARARNVLSGAAASAPDGAALRDMLERFIAAFHYAGAALVDPSGVPRLEVNTSHQDQERYRTFQLAAAGAVFVSDLYMDTRSGRPWMLLTVPVPGAGALILDIDPSEFLYPYVRSWPTSSFTGESLLVRREGDDLVYLSDSRFAGRAPLWGRGLGSEVPRTAASSMSGSLRQWTDSRGVPVMGVLQEIPDLNWFLIAKMDVAEVTAPLHHLGWEMLLVLTLLAATNAAGAGLIWRNQQLRIYRDREAWFRQITDDTPACLWMTSPGAENTFINRQLARFLGTDRDHLDTLWENYIHRDDESRVLDESAKCVRERREYRDEFRMRRFDGHYRWTAVHGLPRYAPSGEFAGYAGALADITERREAEEQLRDANQALAAELIERTRSEKEIQALSARLINAQEEERTRLARELHDDLSQQVAAVSIAIGNLKRYLPADSSDAIERAARIQKKLVDLAECIRLLSHKLHPSVLEHSGLAAALRSYCAEYAALTSRRIVFHADGSSDAIPPALALCVYRVAQEALQNSIKHAHADEAQVFLTRSSGELRLVVSDRGVGIDPGAARGLGLVSIKERTRLVNGTVDVNGKPGEGVTVTLKIPLAAAAQAG